MLKLLIVGPVAVLLGLVYALAFGLIGGALIGACILLWPFAWLFDAIVHRLPRRSVLRRAPLIWKLPRSALAEVRI